MRKINELWLLLLLPIVALSVFFCCDNKKPKPTTKRAISIAPQTISPPITCHVHCSTGEQTYIQGIDVHYVMSDTPPKSQTPSYVTGDQARAIMRTIQKEKRLFDEEEEIEMMLILHNLRHATATNFSCWLCARTNNTMGTK